MSRLALAANPLDSRDWDVDCVIIGVNAAPTLARCIESVLGSGYDRGSLFVYYADGGSTDDSLSIAGRFPEVQVIELHPAYPTPGLGRNAGWRAGEAPFVQFLDSDTILGPHWLEHAVAALSADSRVGAVRGNRQEMAPEVSVFNWIGDLEWNSPPGECEAFGGDVMILRRVLEATGGYDESLVGGEDPELSQRVRLQGYTILQLDTLMTRHDLAMTHVSEYWRRAYRTGYGYAAVTLRFLTRARGFWLQELIRIVVRGGGGIGLFAAGLFGAGWHPLMLLLCIPAGLLLLFPRIFRIAHFMGEKALPLDLARKYAWHCSFIVVPEFFGVARFVLGMVSGKPLRNRRQALTTRAVNPEKQ